MPDASSYPSKDIRPAFRQTVPEFDPAASLKLSTVRNPLPDATLGDLGVAARVSGPSRFPPSLLVQPLGATNLRGIDRTTVRMFRADARTGSFEPVWNSGINAPMGFAWAMIERPGIYVPVGLPRDRLLQHLLRRLAAERAMRDATSPEVAEELTRKVLAPLQEVSGDELEELRRFLIVLESQTGLVPLAPGEADLGHGGHLRPIPLPGGGALEAFRGRLGRLRTPAGGLPEERLFFPPEDVGGTLPPWTLSEQASRNWDELRPDISRALGNLDRLLPRFHFCWFSSPDWWMYHHDEVHSGTASGCSAISSLNAQSLALQPVTSVDGDVVSVPTIVDGKIYVGTGTAPGGGTLYKIDLATGVVDGSFPTTGVASYPGYAGVGGSPAVVGNRVYFTALHGKVYCLDARTMTPAAPHPPALWITDLKSPSQGQNQPITNPNGDCWSGPLVVNGKVYVGSGEGEYGAFGFVWCLDASTGRVSWVFCTNRFTTAADNAPNVLPAAAAPGGLPAWASNAGFSVSADNPANTGASVWSSCAYDAVTNRIFVGTGNAADGLPDADYGSGLLSLDADTGEFQGFFQPSQSDSYYPGDSDVDCPGSPTVYWQGDTRVVGMGSKNGSYFLLDTSTMAVLARRQLLPKDAITGAHLPNVAPGGAYGWENRSGVFGTAAVDYALGRLFIGLGGYADFEPNTTPFLRAVEWSTLDDAWATSVDVVGANHVARYVVPRPPMYGPGSAAGLSSPAVVNDVVFVSTSAPALYALSAATGLCLWQAPGLSGWGYVLGPAAYEDWVVVGCGPAVYRYHLPCPWWCRPRWHPRWPRFVPPIYDYDPWWRLRPPPPPPGPEPGPENEH
jgi:outer membrane protein assembly factor BamB